MQAEGGGLAAAAPLVELAAAGLQRVGLQLLPLHRATAKLGHIVSSLMAGLVQEGFCTPPDAADGERAAASPLTSALCTAAALHSCLTGSYHPLRTIRRL